MLIGEPADLIIVNAHVVTCDPAISDAEAVAVGGRRIVFVGDAAGALAWRGPATRLIDAGGASLLPGFIDSHCHLFPGALKMDAIQLGAVRSFSDLSDTIRSYLDHSPERYWLAGYGLSYHLPPERRPLSRQLLDSIVADHPLIVFAYDHHTAWANTLALRLAGILHGGDAGPNSQIVIAADGLASGELREWGAYRLVKNLIPPPDDQRKYTLLRQAIDQALRCGLTSLHTMDGSAEQLAWYVRMEQSGELPLRVYCTFNVTNETDETMLEAYAAQRSQYVGEQVRIGSVKLFMDGVVESYTALLLEPYADRPDCWGSGQIDEERFVELSCIADRLDLQLCMHAVGDAAVRRVLDGLSAVRLLNGPRRRRHRIEHAELVHPDDIPRFSDLGVIASMQPIHASMIAGPRDVWPARVGQERWISSFPWRSLHNAGAVLAFGSDWPIADQRPLLGIQAALTLQPGLPGRTFQHLSLDAAITAYTYGAAFAEFAEHRKGQLRAGFLADLVLLSADLRSLPAEAIGQLQIALTVCDGRIVYES